MKMCMVQVQSTGNMLAPATSNSCKCNQSRTTTLAMLNPTTTPLPADDMQRNNITTNITHPAPSPAECWQASRYRSLQLNERNDSCWSHDED
jgi:hypothetical protein